MQYQKVQSVSKKINARGPQLDKVILETMAMASAIVGSTLGPGGRQVLIERQEFGLPPMITKDGVTVYRSLGYTDPTAQAIMEAARDASVRTASEAGDGTTTATVLSESLVRGLKEFTATNARHSPQRLIRTFEKAFSTVIEPTIRLHSTKADMSTAEGQRFLTEVAKVSANGDMDLAKAVMKCFELVGDDGNVTIAETSGASAYEVEQIKGYPILMGFEESGAKFYPKFVNDQANQRVFLDAPTFVLYYGRIQDPQSLFGVLNKIGYEFEAGHIGPNVVLVATGFSESVLGYLGMMFQASSALNVMPLLAPQTPFPNGQLEFLHDLAAVTGATVLEQGGGIGFEDATMEHFGRMKSFEATRFRSTVMGDSDPDSVFVRVDELKTQLSRAESALEVTFLQERIGKLTGGIAQLKVIGATNGELKEKRDRAEDAVCAVRGAIKHGVLPGGCWTLLMLSKMLSADSNKSLHVLAQALRAPFIRLLENAGVTRPDEQARIEEGILFGFGFGTNGQANPAGAVVYDLLSEQHVNAFAGGILDSTPAVLEAIRNSISIAALLGTLGGTVVFNRDVTLERQEARDASSFERNLNEANERA